MVPLFGRKNSYFFCFCGFSPHYLNESRIILQFWINPEFTKKYRNVDKYINRGWSVDNAALVGNIVILGVNYIYNRIIFLAELSFTIFKRFFGIFSDIFDFFKIFTIASKIFPIFERFHKFKKLFVIFNIFLNIFAIVSKISIFSKFWKIS